MSQAEYIFIQSTIHAIYYPREFDCKTCVTEYTKRPDYRARQVEYDGLLVKKQGLKGCKSIDKVRAQVEDIKYHRCLGNFRSDMVANYMEAYHQYKLGNLPFDGNFLSQPSKIIDVFNLIDACIKVKQAELEEKEKRKAKNGRR